MGFITIKQTIILVIEYVSRCFSQAASSRVGSQASKQLKKKETSQTWKNFQLF